MPHRLLKIWVDYSRMVCNPDEAKLSMQTFIKNGFIIWSVPVSEYLISFHSLCVIFFSRYFSYHMSVVHVSLIQLHSERILVWKYFHHKFFSDQYPMRKFHLALNEWVHTPSSPKIVLFQSFYDMIWSKNTHALLHLIERHQSHFPPKHRSILFLSGLLISLFS